jgi:hypothetical protein
VKKEHRLSGTFLVNFDLGFAELDDIAFQALPPHTAAPCAAASALADYHHGSAHRQRPLRRGARRKPVAPGDEVSKFISLINRF